MNSSTTVNRGKHADGETHPEPPPSVGGTTFEPLLNTEEAAALLKIHPKTLQKFARGGKVDAIQIGKLWRFRASALNRWLEEITER